MDKIFQRAEDKFVAARIVYTSEGELYYDSDFSEKVPEEDLKNLFVKGVLLSDSGALYAATSYSETDGITFANAGSDDLGE